MVNRAFYVYGPPSRLVFEGDYNSIACLIPDVDAVIEHLKEEIERASSINPKKDLTIGIGILYDSKVVSLARDASKRTELSDILSNREAEIELREHAKRFPNVKSVSINTGPHHICKRSVWVIGNYTGN